MPKGKQNARLISWSAIPSTSRSAFAQSADRRISTVVSAEGIANDDGVAVLLVARGKEQGDRGASCQIYEPRKMRRSGRLSSGGSAAGV